ncbi:hypothetical protein J8J42_12750 [Chryseobacterium sp. cx-311]|uniref:hypothetical protein n=1 Tax=Marnyiella aurantia TaxID=2758037 RepID=UPI001AE3A01D|nr:hypothetical protein [Marnyiella aurantia]MBP0613908.1 hypothetical protein [Marnyiella aurantia]
MKKNLKKAIIGVASSLILVVNVLAPAQIGANTFAVATPVNSTVQDPNESIQPEHTTVLVVIMVAVATIKGLQFTDDAQANLANLD